MSPVTLDNPTTAPTPPDLGPLDAVIFDTDGVITRTAEVHRSSWKRLFDDYLAERSGDTGGEFTEEDYLAHVDGRPRYDGVAAFLSARGIELAWGDRSDRPGTETICGLGNAKNAYFRDEVEQHGVRAYDTTVALVADLRAAGVAVAAVSASENQRLVLEAAELAEDFDLLVDGVMTRERNLAGKPDPALFLEAASGLDVAPERAAVVEDARPGVTAGRRGGFAVVIGVDRAGRPDELAAAGADVVVDDLEELSTYVDQQGRCWLRTGGPR